MQPLPFSQQLADPALKHVGARTSGHSDLYVTVQLYADSKPLTVLVQTAYKAFKTQRS